MNEPLAPADATRTLRAILAADGDFSFSDHAKREMAEDKMDEADILNVLRGGRMFEPAEFENGTWRYRFHTYKFCVVVAFRSESEFRVVTAWRKP